MADESIRDLLARLRVELAGLHGGLAERTVKLGLAERSVEAITPVVGAFEQAARTDPAARQYLDAFRPAVVALTNEARAVRVEAERKPSGAFISRTNASGRIVLEPGFCGWPLPARGSIARRR